MPHSTLPFYIREYFKIKKWKWYIVDFRNWHRPEIIQKHFDTKEQAWDFKETYLGRGFEIVNWKKAFNRGLYKFKSQKNSRGLARNPKFKYPPDCKTQYQRQLFRNNERRRMRTNRERPKVSKKVIREIIEDKPMLFMKRLNGFRNNHWTYSQPVRGFTRWKEKFGYDMIAVEILSNIVRCLEKHYDLGPYYSDEVAEILNEMYPMWIDKWLKPDGVYGPRLQYVEAEFLARGFKPIFEVNPDPEGHYIRSIYLGQIYVFPERCWHEFSEKKKFKYYIYDLQAMIGIPGYTEAFVAGFDKRK